MKTKEREISGDTALAPVAVVTQLLTSQVLRVRSLSLLQVVLCSRPHEVEIKVLGDCVSI